MHLASPIEQPVTISAGAAPPESGFLAAAIAGANCFLTGAGGTGKSTQLRAFIAAVIAGPLPRKVSITAPTGVAALNIGGMTIHRFCGMLTGPASGQSDESYFDQLQSDKRWSIQAGFRRVRQCEVLVIDEISMLPGRQFEFIDFLFRRLRGRAQPFGGCQVITVGDFLQLPPVRTDESARYDWAFLTPAWQAMGFHTFILNQVHRQDEPQFIRALSDFRLGRVRGEGAQLLQARVRQNPPARLPRLFTHNVQVEKWNNFQLSELPGDEVVLEAQQTGPDLQRAFLMKNLATPARLRLKPGALVMFTVNRASSRGTPSSVVNGQLGVVETVGVGEVIVKIKGGESTSVLPFTWRYDQQDETSASFCQYPLRLAWAMTIHRAQGISLDAAYLDIRAAREPGQAYVAVSRVRTLAGLHFKDWFKGIHVSPEAIDFYREAKC